MRRPCSTFSSLRTRFRATRRWSAPPSDRPVGRSRSLRRWSSSSCRRAGGWGGDRAALGEKTAPRSKNERMDWEHVLVDEVSPHQRLHQLAAAEDHEILARLLLELATASTASPSRKL